MGDRVWGTDSLYGLGELSVFLSVSPIIDKVRAKVLPEDLES